jgi:hypothetical protein
MRRSDEVEPGAQSDLEAVWARIEAHAGEFFRTRGERWFSYRIDGECVLPSHSELRIPRSDFALAYALLPIPKPGKLARLVTGAEYLWAILHDPRISRGAW